MKKNEYEQINLAMKKYETVLNDVQAKLQTSMAWLYGKPRITSGDR